MIATALGRVRRIRLRVGQVFHRLLRRVGFASSDYWESRYQIGRSSGAGSYGRLATYKAEFLNQFIDEHGVVDVIEFGCGDGAQLQLIRYPRYLGLDVSNTAVELCRKRFSDDASKSFDVVAAYDGTQFDLAVSLDVVYHLVEDDVFNHYMEHLFGAARRFVIVYSSNTDNPADLGITQVAEHVRHRRFTPWVERNAPDWTLQTVVPNAFPFAGDHETGSFADFYVFTRRSDVRSSSD